MEGQRSAAYRYLKSVYSRISDGFLEAIKTYRTNRHKVNERRRVATDLIDRLAKSDAVCKRDEELREKIPPLQRRAVGCLRLGLLEALLYMQFGPLEVEFAEMFGGGLPQPHVDSNFVRDFVAGFDYNDIKKSGLFDDQSELKMARNKRKKMKRCNNSLTELRAEQEPDYKVGESAVLKKFFQDCHSVGRCSAPMTAEEVKKRGDLEAVSYAFVVRQEKPVCPKYPDGYKDRICVHECDKNSHANDREQIVFDDTRSYVEALALLNLPLEFCEPGAWSGLVQSGSSFFKSLRAYQERLAAGGGSTDAGSGEGLGTLETYVKKEYGPAEAILGFSVDMIDAYYCCPVGNFMANVVGFWDSDSSVKSYVYVLFYVLHMGTVASVYAFLRLSAAVVFIARTYGWVCCASYIDDFNGFEYASTARSGFLFLCMVFDVLGLPRHPEGEKSLCGSLIKMLGVWFDLRESFPVLDIPPEKREKIAILATRLLEEIQKGRYVGDKGFQQLVGSCAFLFCTVNFRAGYHAIRLLFKTLSSDTRRGIPKMQLVDCLRRVVRLAYGTPPFRLDLRPFYSRMVRITCDASKRRIGGMLELDGVRLGFSVEIPISLGPVTIYYAEVFAIYYAFLVWGNIVSRRRVLVCGDNTSGDASIINGYSKSCEATSRLVEATHTLVTGFHIFAWYEYIFTSANRVDGLSRPELLEGTVKKYGIRLVPHETLPEIFRLP